MSYECLVLFLPQSTDIFDIFLNSEQQLEYICVVLSWKLLLNDDVIFVHILLWKDKNKKNSKNWNVYIIQQLISSEHNIHGLLW